MPVQSTSFSLGHEGALEKIFVSLQREKYREYLLKDISQQLADLWEIIEEYPTILASKDSQECLQLSKNLQADLNSAKVTSNPKNGISNSYLIIVDRSYDLRTPLVHDITFQPLVYDLFAEDKDTLNCDYFSHTQIETDRQIKVCLTSEDEPQWQTVKYLPLPKVLQHFQSEISHSMDKGLRKSYVGNMHLQESKPTMKGLQKTMAFSCF